MNPEIRSSVLCTETAKGVWDELHVRFGKKYGVHLFSVQKELSTLAQGALSISSFFTKIKSSWDELSHLHRFPSCSCGAIAAIVKHRMSRG